MSSRTSRLTRWASAAVVLMAGVSAVGLTAVALEALNDRDWALRGWELPAVFSIALLSHSRWSISCRSGQPE